MDNGQRVSRKWYRTAKVAILLIAVPLVLLMALDGFHVLELAVLVVAIGAALYEASRADQLQEQVSRIHELIDQRGSDGV